MSAPAFDPQRKQLAKEAAARRALDLVEPGMTVGLGSGSTSEAFVRALGGKVASGLAVRCLASSVGIETLARSLGLVVLAPYELGAAPLELMVDGADEVDPDGHMIKGRGGALLREKILASRARKLVILVDRSKLVTKLGAMPVPVEVVRFARPWLARELATTGARPVLRVRSDGTPFITDEGHEILDLGFDPSHPLDVRAMADLLDRTTGVVEHGLFLDRSPHVIVGEP